MRFLVDECTGIAVTEFLRDRGFDVTDAQESGSGTDDVEWLSFAVAENRVVVTDDKDFGEAVYRDHLPHAGIVLLRLPKSTPATRVEAIERVLDQYGESIVGQFIVVTDRKIRFAKPI
ncbi:MAG: DUF5615 family PIN-like protein [Planctomycetaceae bacterium]